MKIYKKLIKPVMLVPASANDYSPKKVPIEPEEKWYPEEDRETLTKKYKHLETTFETLVFEEKYEEVDFALMKDREAVPVIQREIMHMLFWCCSSCGVAITDGDKFCRNCGKELKWE